MARSMDQSNEQDILAVSLGMVIIDEIRLPNRSPILDVAGGSGLFTTLGCRLFAGTTRSSDVGSLVLAGDDFPIAIREQLSDWDLTSVIKTFPGKKSSRGLLEYKDDTFGPKRFQYTTPPLKATPSDLVDTPLLSAKAIHLFATPDEIRNQVPELIHLRSLHGIQERPFIVWEPFPAACKSSSRESFLDACRLVDVFSPNHLELMGLYHDQHLEAVDPGQLEGYALEFAQRTGRDGKGTVIVRAGTHGSLTTLDSRKVLWLPAFYEDKSAKILDPTGAGNTFLGGFIAGWQFFRDLNTASIYGNVAASFALEQIGLPFRQGSGDQELWNDVDVMARVEEYKERLQAQGRL